MHETVFINGLYKHYKGGYYIVVGVCKLTETNDLGVLYYQVGNPEVLYCRPKTIFFCKIDLDGNISEMVPQFTYIGATRSPKTHFIMD